MKDLQKLADLLRNARGSLGLTRTEAALRAGISVSHLWVLEGGNNPKTGKQSTPSFDVCLRLAEVLRVQRTTILELAGYSTASHDEESGVRQVLESLAGEGYGAPTFDGDSRMIKQADLDLASQLMDQLNGRRVAEPYRTTLSKVLIRHARDLLRLSPHLELPNKG